MRSGNGAGGNNEGGGDLEAVRQRLQRWRSRHGGRGRRIPVALWDEAVTLARSEGVEAVARALRLDTRGLARRLAAVHAGTDERASDRSPPFVELAAAELGQRAVAGSCVEVINVAGERLRIEVAGGVDVAALVRGFQGRD